MALVGKDAVGGDLPPFFDPEKHANDVALLLEPVSWREGRSKFKDQVTGEYKKTQIVNTKVTVFRAQAHLDKGEPFSTELVAINATVLARDLVKLLDDSKAKGDDAPALIAVIRRVPTKSGNDTWVFRVPSDEVYDKVAEYYEKRQAAFQAALDSAPDFD